MITIDLNERRLRCDVTLPGVLKACNGLHRGVAPLTPPSSRGNKEANKYAHEAHNCELLSLPSHYRYSQMVRCSTSEMPATYRRCPASGARNGHHHLAGEHVDVHIQATSGVGQGQLEPLHTARSDLVLKRRLTERQRFNRLCVRTQSQAHTRTHAQQPQQQNDNNNSSHESRISTGTATNNSRLHLFWVDISSDLDHTVVSRKHSKCERNAGFRVRPRWVVGGCKNHACPSSKHVTPTMCDKHAGRQTTNRQAWYCSGRPDKLGAGAAGVVC